MSEAIESIHRAYRDELAARRDENKRMREALEAIATYPKKGVKRRTKDGYPLEVVYDEWAYKRMVDSYRDGARAAIEMSGGVK